MRKLDIKEIKKIQPIIDAAIEEAKLSPCAKSKRGAVVFRDGKILGRGFNAPPDPFKCDGSCLPICRHFAIHAEQNAIYNAVDQGHQLKDASIFHIKVYEGNPCTTNTFSCMECGKLILRFNLKEFILFQDQGYVAYPPEEYQRLTIEYLMRQNKL